MSASTDTGRHCPYCFADNSRKLYETLDMYDHTFQVNQCNNCNTVFLSPNPTPEQLEQAYSESYYGEQEQKFNTLVERVVDFFRKQRAGIISGYIPSTAKVLDIGCGNGRFLYHLLKKGNYEAYGIELPGKAAERASKVEGLILKQGKLEPGDFQDSSLDAVTMFHVIEHLDQPRQTLQIIGQIVKPGGIAYISMPNIDSWQSRLFKGKWLHLDPPRHVFFLSPRHLQHEMQQLGFQLEKERYFNPEYNPFGMQQSLLNMVSPKRELLFEHLKGNRQYVGNFSTAALMLQSLFFKATFPLFILSDALESAFKKGATVEMVFRKQDSNL
ncbi:MAG: class I SAM-dependent methyltransferase [Sphingobacteriales bacterium]|nr:MAG: class I SAM-dependent methyltransferase [Sphingobacteriales bacterium]